MIWVQFVVCAGLVIVVGSLLSRYADVLAEKTGLGRSWIGGVLLAGATSLPELATGASAVVVVGDIDLAAGGIMGSCLFNLLLLALLDAASWPEPLLRRAEISHVLAAAVGCLLLSITMIGLVLGQMLPLPTLAWVGLPSVALLLGYIISVRMISRFELRRTQEVLEREAVVYQYAAIPLWRAALTFGLLALAILGLGVWLAALGDQIAVQTGLGASFVGSIFLAITTSLPEIVASFMALRLNAVDLAVSNIFGSNIFNLAILGSYDLLDTRGSIWERLAAIHGLAAMFSVLMTAIAIIGLVYSAAQKPRWRLNWDALLIVVSYAGAMYLIYRAG